MVYRRPDGKVNACKSMPMPLQLNFVLRDIKCNVFKRISNSIICNSDKNNKPITITDPEMTRYLMT